jgi:hypothetical protein
MGLVQKALPLVQRVISENIVKACPKVGGGASYSISRMNNEEKKRKAIERPLKMGQCARKKRNSGSFEFVNEFRKEHKVLKVSPDLPSFIPKPAPEREPGRVETRYSLASFPADDATPEFPKPIHGNAQFCPAEVLSIMDSFGEGKDADKKRRAVKKVMIDKRLIGPAHKRSLDKFLLKVERSGGTKIPAHWSNSGRPVLVSMPELRVMAARMREKRGHTLKLPAFMTIVTDHLTAKYKAEGKATFGVDIAPCTRTIQNMMVLLAAMEEQELLEFRYVHEWFPHQAHFHILCCRANGAGLHYGGWP